MPRKPKKPRAVVRFRLTLAGWLYLGISVLLGAASVKSQTALMFVVFGAMIGALHVSAVMARRIVRSVDVERHMPARAWQYQTVPLGYHLRNTRRRKACLGLVLHEHGAEGLDSVAGFCAHLPGGSVFHAGGRFAARSRGRVRLREVRISTTFPFGLVKAYKRILMKGSVVIWPARGRLTSRLLHRGAVESSTSAPSPATGGQDEFFGLREYRPGDNARWIHWRRSANKATPVIREMARPLPEMLWVVLDTHRRGAEESALADRERRLRFAATLLDYAFARGYQVGLAMASGGRVLAEAPAPGRGQRQLLLDHLAQVPDGPAAPLAEVLRALRRDQLALSQVVLVAGDARALGGAPRSIFGGAGACRSLTVLTDRDLPRVFRDAPEASAVPGTDTGTPGDSGICAQNSAGAPPAAAPQTEGA